MLIMLRRSLKRSKIANLHSGCYWWLILHDIVNILKVRKSSDHFNCHNITHHNTLTYSLIALKASILMAMIATPNGMETILINWKLCLQKVLSALNSVTFHPPWAVSSRYSVSLRQYIMLQSRGGHALMRRGHVTK